MEDLDNILLPLLTEKISLTAHYIIQQFEGANHSKDNAIKASWGQYLHEWLDSELEQIISGAAEVGKESLSASQSFSRKLVQIDSESGAGIYVEKLGKIFTTLTMHHQIGMLSAMGVIMKSMGILVTFEGSSVLKSEVFSSLDLLTSWVKICIGDLAHIIKALGSEVLSEFIRVAILIDRLKDWRVISALQSSLEPWDHVPTERHFTLGERYDTTDHFQRSIYEENESKLDYSSRTDTELFNERKKCFDSLSSLYRRWGEGYRDPADLPTLKRDLLYHSQEILKVNRRNLPWVVKLFIEKYLQAELAHRTHGNNNTKNNIPLPAQSSYANRLKESLGLSPVVDTSVILKLERRLEAQSGSHVGAETTSTTTINNNTNNSSSSANSPILSPSQTSPFYPAQINSTPRSSAMSIRSKPSSGRPYRDKYSPSTPTPHATTGTSHAVAYIELLFPKPLHFFAYFVMENNNFLFNQQCSVQIVLIIQQLCLPSVLGSYHTESLESAINKLKQLGKLLAFIEFHYLSHSELVGRKEDAEEMSSIISVLPLTAMLKESLQSGSVCLTVPWIVSFLKVLKLHSLLNSVDKYYDTVVALYTIQHKNSLYSLDSSDITSNRLTAIIEIQSLWDHFPQALEVVKAQVKKDPVTEFFRSQSAHINHANAIDNGSYAWSNQYFQSISSNFHKQFVELKQLQRKPTLIMDALSSPMSTPSQSEPLSVRKAKRQSIMPVETVLLGNIATSAFSPESFSRSSSISIISTADRLSPPVKATSSSALSLKKKTPSKVLLSTSPATEMGERKRNNSSASKPMISSNAKAKGLPAKNLFPDDQKLLLDRMEGSFWDQHSALQSIHSFVFTNANQVVIAQIKEFMALNLRRIVNEVDSMSRKWCTQPCLDSDTFKTDEKLPEDWLEYYKEELSSLGKKMIEEKYASIRIRLVAEYSGYPEHIRVIKLAVFYTKKHLHSQQQAMLMHLKEYNARKLRELMEKKTKAICKAYEQGRHESRFDKYALVILRNVPTLSTPNMINNHYPMNALMIDRAIQKLIANRVLVFETIEPNNITMLWTLSADITSNATKLLNTIGMITSILTELGEAIRCQYVCQVITERLPYSYPVINLYVTEIMDEYGNGIAGQHANRIMLYTGLLRTFVHYLGSIVVRSSSPISQETKGKLGIEMTKFMLSALPGLIFLDFITISKNKVEVNATAMLAELLNGSDDFLPSSVAICLVVTQELVPVGSMISTLSSLYREKTAAFYEHGKGLAAMSWLLPQGILSLLARLVLSLTERNSKELTAWYASPLLVHHMVSFGDSERLFHFMSGIMDNYVNGSDVHRVFDVNV